MQIFVLGEIPESASHSVGGKARGLNMLKKAGLKIAEGFVIEGIENEADIHEASDFYFQRKMKEVAVRSSAVSEDGKDFSYAGQFQSFLNISGKENLIEAIHKCLNSLQNTNVSSYINFFSQDTDNKMSVIIQKMVEAKKAGVCFTKDPVEDGKYLLIEAVEGLGEHLVSGNKTAKQYRFFPDGMLKKDYSEDGLLNQEELTRIKDQALLAYSFYGMHLDMGWAIDTEGELYWLQARPITTNDEPDISELDVKLDIRNDYITNCNISKMLPGAVTPLSLSTSVNSIDFGMRKMLVETGVYRKMEHIPPTSCILSVGNHLFINLSTLYSMENHIIGASSDAVDMSLCGRVLENVERPKDKRSNIFVRLNNARKYFKMFSSKDRARLEIERLASKFKIIVPMQEPQGISADTVQELFYEIDRSLEVLDHAFWLHYITSCHSGAMASALFMMLNRDIEDNEKSRSIIASLIDDIDDIESVDILRSLRKLASEILAKNPSAAHLSSSEIFYLLDECSGSIRETYENFIKRHGHRAIREAEIYSKSWSNDKAGLANYLKAVILSGAVEEMKENTIDKNISKLCQKYNPVKRKILLYLISQARKGVKNREFSKSMCIKVLDQFKNAYAVLAKCMVENSLLPDEDLIYFLQHDEIRRLLTRREPALIKKALLRKRIFPEMKNLKFREIYRGKPVPVVVENTILDPETVLNGSPASRGIATGRARVVKTTEDVNKLEKGKIMIASFTDIGWSPYYCLISALVTEIGSVLSHGVVVAR